MSIPLVPILVALILLCTLLWAARTLLTNEQAKRVVTVVLVVLFVLWFVVTVFDVDLGIHGARGARPLFR